MDNHLRLPFSSSEKERAKRGIELIYCDWSHQDWVPEKQPVDEQMVLDTAAVFRRWREEFDFPFAYYLIDVFWFDPDHPYDRWRREGFPNGPERSLGAIEEAGMKPGLWFCNKHPGIMPKPAEWSESLDNSGHGYVISAGPYREGLHRAWQKAYEQWGMRMVKFDFVGLDAKLPDDPVPEQRPALNRRAFRELVTDFKTEHPDVRFLLYNGFRSGEGTGFGNTLEDPARTCSISSEWADYCDWTYCGDTRPADLPCLRLRRSCEIYNDHQIRRWHWAGFPLHKIDECGCYVGSGGSWYELGPKDFRSSWLLTLVRGGQKAMLYGDPSPLTDDDVRWMKATYERADRLVRRGAKVSLLGGWPASGDPYGYFLSKGTDGWAVAINPQWSSVEFRIPTRGRPAAACLASDQGEPVPMKTHQHGIDVTIPPNQMVLIGLGRESETPLPDMRLTEGEWPAELLPRGVQRSGENGSLTFRLERDDVQDVTWVVRLWKDGQRYRQPGWGEDRTLSEYLGLETSPCRRRESFHDRPLWSGLSYWVETQFGATSTPILKLACEDEELDVTVEAYEYRRS